MSDYAILDSEVSTKTKSAKTETIDKKDPFVYQKIADDFLIDMAMKRQSYILYYQGRTLRYDGRKYLVENEMGNFLRRYLLERHVPFNNNLVGNVLPIIEARMNCDAQLYPQLPFFKPERGKIAPCDPRNVIAFKNGLLDVSKAIQGDNQLIPHNHSWVSLSCLPHEFDPTAQCPRWLSFLDEILEGDKEKLANLQEFFGYVLTPDNSYQKMLVLLGVSRSGKGTVVNVMESMLGSDAMTGYSLTSLADKFGLGGLVGKLVASVGEVNLQRHPQKYQIFERINNITGGDPVEVEFKHNPLKMSVRLPVRFVVACNEMPQFADDSGALAERLVLINFEKACPKEKRDTKLAEKLVTEISGITNWALEGLSRIRTQGAFSTGVKTEEMLNEIRRNNSHALAFAQDRLLIHSSLDTGNLPGVTLVGDTSIEGVWTLESQLRLAYSEWAANNSRPTESTYLFANLRTILPKLKRGKKGLIVDKRENTVVGVRLTSNN